MWVQHEILLNPRPRGFHLITAELVAHMPELFRLKVGLAHFFIQHTSASLVINENADPAAISWVKDCAKKLGKAKCRELSIFWME